MDDEASETISRILSKPSFMEKLKFRIKIIMTGNKQVSIMRQDIISHLKPKVFEHSKDPNIRDVFDERIYTLSKRNILELHEYLNYYFNLKTQEARQTMLSFLIINLELSYSVNGWYRKKIVERIIRSKQYV